MNWTDIRRLLKGAPNEFLIDTIKKLYDLSDENKALLRTTFSASRTDVDLLEKSRKQVIRAIYPENRAIPGNPHLGESRKVVRAYQKATRDVAGTLDLMLTHVERGTDFTKTFGDIDESFYNSLTIMLSDAIELLCESPNAADLYQQLKPRFRRLLRATHNIGWGYGDDVDEMIGELAERFPD